MVTWIKDIWKENQSINCLQTSTCLALRQNFFFKPYYDWLFGFVEITFHLDFALGICTQSLGATKFIQLLWLIFFYDVWLFNSSGFNCGKSLRASPVVKWLSPCAPLWWPRVFAGLDPGCGPTTAHQVICWGGVPHSRTRRTYN